MQSGMGGVSALSQVRDFLDRFRPAGVPGTASRAGVPADLAGEPAGELQTVLALLVGTDAECGRKIPTRNEAPGGPPMALASGQHAIRLAAAGTPPRRPAATQ